VVACGCCTPPSGLLLLVVSDRLAMSSSLANESSPLFAVRCLDAEAGVAGMFYVCVCFLMGLSFSISKQLAEAEGGGKSV
jgi:hypothetical protein